MLWALLIVAAAYGAGHVVRLALGDRVGRLFTRIRGRWDEVLAHEVGRRIPFWAFLIALRLALERWPLPPLGTLDLQHDVFSAILVVGVVSVTLALAAIASRMVVAYGPRAAPGLPVTGLTQNVVRIVIYVLGCLVVLGQGFNIEIRPMLAALGVGGLAVALAIQEPLSNLFAGIFIAVASQIRIGDYIRLDNGVEGVVVDFNWRSTRLRQLADNIVIVPNAKLSQAIVTNFSLPTGELTVNVEVTVDRTADLDQVEEVAQTVAMKIVQEAAGAVPTSPASVRYHEFTDAGVRLSVAVRARSIVDQVAVKDTLIRQLHAAFAREGIGPPIARAMTVSEKIAPPATP